LKLKGTIKLLLLLSSRCKVVVYVLFEAKFRIRVLKFIHSFIENELNHWMTTKTDKITEVPSCFVIYANISVLVTSLPLSKRLWNPKRKAVNQRANSQSGRIILVAANHCRRFYLFLFTYFLCDSYRVTNVQTWPTRKPCT
jgi:hypothetical protein